ncbi:MAG TPA: hypothetical protein ENI76_02540, partial [Ignavibacteria bacterium]|nr:hypothetical protein [Ignavibacteria bacterium]
MNINESIKKGLEDCYSFRWDDAQKNFRSIIRYFPNNPEGYHYLASTYLWFYLSNLNQKDYKNFLAYSDTALEKAKAKINVDSNDTNILYILGADYSYRAIAFEKAGKFIDAAWASKKSEYYLKKCLLKDSTFYDAYLGLGIYNFAIGQISPAYRWALSLIGIKGNKALGIKYIKLAAKKGKLSKIEAEYYLSGILSNYFNDYTGAAKYLRNLVNIYPSNLLFNYSYSTLKIKQHQLNIAKKILKGILKNKNLKFTQIISYSNFLMGDIYFKENEFDSAKVYYKNFLNTSLSKDYTGIAYYRLGLSYEIKGQRDSALKYYNLATHVKSNTEDDIFAKRKGEYLQKHVLNQIEIALIENNNLIENGKYKIAYDSLQLILPKINDVQLRAKANLRLSNAAYWLGNYEKSYTSAILAKELNNSEDNW